MKITVSWPPGQNHDLVTRNIDDSGVPFHENWWNSNGLVNFSRFHHNHERAELLHFYSFGSYSKRFGMSKLHKIHNGENFFDFWFFDFRQNIHQEVVFTTSKAKKSIFWMILRIFCPGKFFHTTFSFFYKSAWKFGFFMIFYF